MFISEDLHNAENSLTESVTTRSKVKSRDREEKDVVALPTSVVANGERTYKGKCVCVCVR